MKGGQVGGVEAEGAESEEENKRGLSLRSRCGGGGLRRSRMCRSEGVEWEGENERRPSRRG